jgi:hypothetical protein
MGCTSTSNSKPAERAGYGLPFLFVLELRPVKPPESKIPSKQLNLKEKCLDEIGSFLVCFR